MKILLWLTQTTLIANIAARSISTATDSDSTATTLSPNKDPSESWPRYLAHHGTRSELSCRIQGDSPLRTEWRRASSDRVFPSSAHQEDGKLIIEATDYDAAGLYECVAHLGEDSFVLQKVVIVVVASPKITISPMPLSVQLGGKVMIVCNATGDEPLKVTWTYGDVDGPLPSGVKQFGNILQFASIQAEHSGRYFCTATNQHGSATMVTQILLPSKPSYKTVTLDEEEDLDNEEETKINDKI